MSAADFLDEWFEDERVKGALATQAIIGAWCGPMTPGSAYVLMHHWIGEIDGHFGAWGWVKGGMGGVSDGDAAVGRARGRRDPHRRSRWRRIAINSEGRAVGVELDDGSLVRAERVISNAHPTTTYLDLVGRDQLPDDVVRDVERFRTRSGSVKVQPGLSELPAFPAWDQEGDRPRAGRDLALDGVPRAGVRRCEVRPGRASTRTPRWCSRRHTSRRARARRQAPGDRVHVSTGPTRCRDTAGRQTTMRTGRG